jgi:hypothetical protein
MIYRDYFISLNNYDGILESPTYYIKPNHEENKIQDQETITFIMLDQGKRTRAWKNATLEKKNDYWIALEMNHELLSEGSSISAEPSIIIYQNTGKLKTVNIKKKIALCNAGKNTVEKLMDQSASDSSLRSSISVADDSHRNLYFSINKSVESESNFTTPSQIARNAVGEEKHPQKRILNEIQIEFWKMLYVDSGEDALSFWTDYLDYFQKVQIWNS